MAENCNFNNSEYTAVRNYDQFAKDMRIISSINNPANMEVIEMFNDTLQHHMLDRKCYFFGYFFYAMGLLTVCFLWVCYSTRQCRFGRIGF